MRYRILYLSLAFAALPCAYGALIFDNGSFNSLNGNNMSDFHQAEDFVLLTNFNVTGFSFYTLEGTTPPSYIGSITYSIRANSAGQPGAVILTGNVTPTRTANGTALGFNVFQNDVTIGSTNLAAGTYWLVLHDGLTSDVTFQDFYWATTNVTAGNTGTNRGREQSLNPASATWDPNLEEHAFTVSGTPAGGVPEPASIFLIGGGLALLSAKRKFLV